MALVGCQDCSRMISTRATSCPHCGCPVSDTGECSSTERGPASIRPLTEKASHPSESSKHANVLGSCSHCGSDDVRRLPLVYETHTSDTSTTSISSGVGIVGGELAYGSGTTT